MQRQTHVHLNEPPKQPLQTETTEKLQPNPLDRPKGAEPEFLAGVFYQQAPCSGMVASCGVAQDLPL